MKHYLATLVVEDSSDPPLRSDEVWSWLESVMAKHPIKDGGVTIKDVRVRKNRGMMKRRY